MGAVLSLELKRHSAKAEHREIVSLCTSQTTGAGARRSQVAMGQEAEIAGQGETQSRARQRLERGLDTGAGTRVV